MVNKLKLLGNKIVLMKTFLISGLIDDYRIKTNNFTELKNNINSTRKIYYSYKWVFTKNVNKE